MPQHELNRQIAAATGESVADVARMGFQVDGPRRTRLRRTPSATTSSPSTGTSRRPAAA